MSGLVARGRAAVTSIWTHHQGTVLYTSASLAKAAMGFVAQFVTLKAVSPASVGLWNSFTLAQTYSAFLQAGVNNGLNRELPFVLGAGDDAAARRLAGTAQAFTVLSCALALLVGGGAAWWFRASAPAVQAAILVETIAVLCFFYQSYLVVTFRSTTSFKRLANVDFANAAIGLAALPLVIYGGFAGMLGRIAVISIVGIVLLHIVRPIRVEWMWDRAALAQLLRTGLPIFGLYYLETSLGTFDRVLLLKHGGLEQVGFYSLSLSVQQALLIVPTSIATYAYPRMTFHWGKDGDRRALWRRAWRSTAAAVGVMVPVVAISFVILPWLVPTLFPKYQAGVLAAQVTLVGALFNQSAIGVNALLSMKAWRAMATYQVGGALLRAAGPFVGVLVAPTPLIGVAAGTTCACAVQFLLGLALTHWMTIGGGAPVNSVAAA